VAAAGTTPAATGKFVLSPADRKELETLLAQANKAFATVEATQNAIVAVDPRTDLSPYGYNEAVFLARAQGGLIDEASSQRDVQDAKSTLRDNLKSYQEVDLRLKELLAFLVAKGNGLRSVREGLARLVEYSADVRVYAGSIADQYPADSDTTRDITGITAELSAITDVFQRAAFKADKDIKAAKSPDVVPIDRIVSDFAAVTLKAERDILSKRTDLGGVEKRSADRAKAAEAKAAKAATAPPVTEAPAPGSRQSTRSSSRGRKSAKDDADEEIVLTPGATPAEDEIVLTPGATPVDEEITLTPGATPVPAAAGRQSRSVSRPRSGGRSSRSTSMVREVPGLSMDDLAGPKVREFLEKIFEKHSDRVFIISAMAAKPPPQVGKILNVMVMVPGEATFPANRDAERAAATNAAQGTILRFNPSDGGVTKLRESTFVIPIVYDSLSTDGWPIKRAILQRMAGALARVVAGNMATSNQELNKELRSSMEPFGPKSKLGLDGSEGTSSEKIPAVTFGVADSLDHLLKPDYDAKSVTKEPATNLFTPRGFKLNTDGLMQGFVSGITSAQVRSKAIAGATHTGRQFEARSGAMAIGDEQAAYGSGTDTDFSDLETARAEVGAEQRGAALPAAPSTPTGRNDAPSAGLSEEWDNWV
jgi:hypothetical protein